MESDNETRMILTMEVNGDDKAVKIIFLKVITDVMGSTVT